MTKKRFFDILIGLIFLCLLGLYLYNHFIAPNKIKKNLRPAITKANDLLRIKTKISDNVLNTTATSSACTLFLKNSAEKSMNDYANDFIDHHVDGIVQTCSGAFPTLLQKRIDDALFACKSSTHEKITKECYASLIEAKTSSVAAIIKTDTDPSILPASILVHLVADKLSTKEFLDMPEKTIELIDALLDKEPNYLGGYKAKLLVLARSSLIKEDYYQDMFQETIDEVKRLNPNDPEIKKIELMTNDKKAQAFDFKFSLDDL